MHDNMGRDLSLKVGDRLLPEGLVFLTGADSSAFFSFSSGVAIGLSSETELRHVRLKQRPFEPSREGFGFEPSVSHLAMNLMKGQIALAAPHLSPVSELIINLPVGTARLQRGVVLIRQTPSTLLIEVREGTLIYSQPFTDRREFLSAGTRLHLSTEEVSQKPVILQERFDLAGSGPGGFEAATRHARTRVLFIGNAENPAPPEAQRVARRYDTHRLSARPYQFKN